MHPATCNDLKLLSAWDVGAVSAVDTPATGTINHTLLVEAERGSYVLRAYRHADRAPIEREHAVIAHVCARGLPAVAPIALPGGETILERDGHYYALFPRAPGRQLPRSQLTAGDFATMGTFLARTHEALRDFPLERAARRDFAVDRVATLASIEQLETAIRARAELSHFDTMVLGQLAGRRAWIAHAPPDQKVGLADLDQQLIHGDYQETNLFFEAGQIIAIIDWDQTYAAPREWEIARALHFPCDYDLDRCRAFLAGYCARAPLDLAALDQAARAYALMRAHDLWQFQAIYFEGNQRIRKFVWPGPFVPLTEQWAALNEQLRIEN